MKEAEVKNLEDQLTLIRHRGTEQEEPVHINDFKEKSNFYYARTESASITGDTVGDPLKDTSGPSLNILIKLSSILSVVFSPLFLSTSFITK